MFLISGLNTYKKVPYLKLVEIIDGVIDG